MREVYTLMETQVGRRRHPRYEASIPVTLSADGIETERTISQISRAGCLISPSTPEVSQAGVTMAFRLDHDLKPILTRGEVIYTIYAKGIGIAFRGIDESDCNRIESFFSELGKQVA